MRYVIGVLLLVTIIIIGIMISKRRKRKNLLALLASSFGKPPGEREFEQESIQLYSHYRSLNSTNNRRVDQITWNDLEMDKAFQRINVCLSSVGEEYLYNCLHEIQLDPSNLVKRESFIKHIESRPEDRLWIQMILAKLGKDDYNSLASLIFSADKNFLAYPIVYNILALIPILSALLLFVSIPLGVSCLVISFTVNTIIYFITKLSIENELPALNSFSSLLFCSKKLCEKESLKSFPQLIVLRENYEVFKQLARNIPGSGPNGASSEMDYFSIYIKTLFLSDIRNYNKTIKKITEYPNEFHALFKAVGEIDLSQCVLSFRKSLPVYATPVFHEENTIEFTDVFHLLVSSPVTNTGIIKNNSMITGSNASGKSTFIKALAVNGILAQTLYTCTAKGFKTRFSLIATSMALRDSISDGDSYFIIEIKSLKRILDLTEKYPCTCYIDEILRGTNTIERIAASTSVLAYLHQQDCLCVAASHDIELTDLLANTFDNYHFSEQITDEGIRFDYTLKKGPSTTRNAIKLLSHLNYNREITDQAEALTDQYEKNKTWQMSVEPRDGNSVEPRDDNSVEPRDGNRRQQS